MRILASGALAVAATVGLFLGPALDSAGAAYATAPSAAGATFAAPASNAGWLAASAAVVSAGPNQSCINPPTPNTCSTNPNQNVCSTLGMPTCSAVLPAFCSVNNQGGICSSGPNGACSATSLPGGDGAGKCSVRGPANEGPSSFCSTFGGICSAVNGGDCSVQAESRGHCSVRKGNGGICTTFDNMSKCSIRPSTGGTGPGTCSVLSPTGEVQPGQICTGG